MSSFALATEPSGLSPMPGNRRSGTVYFPSMQSGTECIIMLAEDLQIKIPCVSIIMLAEDLQIKIPCVSSDLQLRRTKQYTLAHYQKNSENLRKHRKCPLS